MGHSMSGTFTRGQRVRCYFGTEHRDGTIEHIAKSGAIHVRVSPGWVHIVHDASDLQTLEFVPSTPGALPVAPCFCIRNDLPLTKRCKQFCETGRIVGPAPVVPRSDGIWS